MLTSQYLQNCCKKKKKIGLCELKLYLGYKSYHGGKLQFTLKHPGIFNLGQNCIHNGIFILRLHQKKNYCGREWTCVLVLSSIISPSHWYCRVDLLQNCLNWRASSEVNYKRHTKTGHGEFETHGCSHIIWCNVPQPCTTQLLDFPFYSVMQCVCSQSCFISNVQERQPKTTAWRFFPLHCMSAQANEWNGFMTCSSLTMPFFPYHQPDDLLPL